MQSSGLTHQPNDPCSALLGGVANLARIAWCPQRACANSRGGRQLFVYGGR